MSPTTPDGVRLLPNAPFPFSPRLPSPQQYAAFVAVSAHVCSFRLALISTKVSPPDTGTGELLLPAPVPNWPELLRPQQYALPSVVSAHVCPPPALRTARVS